METEPENFGNIIDDEILPTTRRFVESALEARRMQFSSYEQARDVSSAVWLAGRAAHILLGATKIAKANGFDTYEPTPEHLRTVDEERELTIRMMHRKLLDFKRFEDSTFDPHWTIVDDAAIGVDERVVSLSPAEVFVMNTLLLNIGETMTAKSIVNYGFMPTIPEANRQSVVTSKLRSLMHRLKLEEMEPFLFARDEDRNVYGISPKLQIADYRS